MLFEHFSQQRLRLDVAGKSSWNCLFEIVFHDYGLTVFTKSSNKTCRKDYYIYILVYFLKSHIFWVQPVILKYIYLWCQHDLNRSLLMETSDDTANLSSVAWVTRGCSHLLVWECKWKARSFVSVAHRKGTQCAPTVSQPTLPPLDPAHTVNVISHMGAVPALSGANICCEKGG